jgi:plasmid maintenance system killer protein
MRLKEQLVKIAKNKARHPSGSYARACGGDRYALKGYYRLMSNEREEMSSNAILAGHRQQTIRRMANEKTVLIIQDTMEMNFSRRLHCEDLGPIGKNQTGAESLGLKMHSRLALNTAGMPLGTLEVQIYAGQKKPKKDQAADRPIEEKESYRWVQTCEDAHLISRQLPGIQIVCIGDRESDIFELFDKRRRQGGRVDLLVRAKHNRCLQDEEAKLFEHMREGKADGHVSITVPRQREKEGKPSKPGRPSLPARTAEVEVRFRQVTICAPQTPLLKDKKPIALWAIYLYEKNPPAAATRIKWLLLTSMEVRSVKQAMKVVRWYCLRWRIEEWHRVLKSGCRVLEHQNHKAEGLARAIVIDAVVAWRIMVLTLLGRELPELRCEMLFNSWECEMLQVLAQKKTFHLAKQLSSSPSWEDI